MSVTHVLELDSQVELLDRLELLTNFGSNLIVINGHDGYGKSWLAQRYLEVGASNKNQCLLLCHFNQDDMQRRILILNQLVSGALFNQQEPLLDSLERLVGDEQCDIAIVVDDAHLLSETLISELWALVLSAHRKPSWVINVLLFTQSGHLEEVLSRLSYGQEVKPIELDIDMLSEVEARHFFESYIVRYVDDESKKRVRDAFKKVVPVPGDIMALGEMKVEKRIIIRSIVGSPLNIALVIFSLLLFTAGGYWWMFNQPSPNDKAQKITDTLEQTPIPTFEEPKLSAAASSLQSVTDDTVSGFDDSGAIDDSNSLPPVVTEEVASVGSDDNQQRVVIESNVVDALLEEGEISANTKSIDDVGEGENFEATDNTASPLINVINSNQGMTQTLAQSEDGEVKQAVVKFSFAREELKALSPRAYTLQLAAMTSMEDVQGFLDEHHLNNQVRIYPTVRNDTEWYIITYKDYSTIQMARDAVASLPDSVKLESPWAKSLRQVHREIERVK